VRTNWASNWTDLKRTEIYTSVSMEDEEDNEAENKL